MARKSDSDVSFALPTEPEAATRARQILRAHLADLDPEAREDLELIVTELVANAVRHAALGPGDTIGVQIYPSGRGLILEVTDCGQGFQRAPSGPGADGSGGYGLFVLDQLAMDWGITQPPTRVWAELPVTTNDRDRN